MSRRFAEIVRFLLAGTANTILTYGADLLLLQVLPYLAAYSPSYASGIALSYAVNSVFVFRKPMSLAGFARFPAVYLVQFAVGALVIWASVEFIAVSEELAAIGAIAITIPLTFLAARYLIVTRGQS